MAESRHIIIVSIWIRPGQESASEAFERDAARIMSRHGGRIDHAVRVNPSATGAGDPPFEVHVVSFPNLAAADSYASDPETLALRERRAGIMARTERLAGRIAGPY